MCDSGRKNQSTGRFTARANFINHKKLAESTSKNDISHDSAANLNSSLKSTKTISKPPGSKKYSVRRAEVSLKKTSRKSEKSLNSSLSKTQKTRGPIVTKIVSTNDKSKFLSNVPTPKFKAHERKHSFHDDSK